MNYVSAKKTDIELRYDIEKIVGEGGAATVYKAWDRVLNKYFAIKKIHSDKAEDPRFEGMIYEEAVNTAKLEHENIVRVVNLIREGREYYMIMDYVNGVDLEFLLKRCRQQNISIPPVIALHIMAEIVKALDYAHNFRDNLTGDTLDIVHRDISPGNIMLYYDGRVKLTDFGIAKIGNSSVKQNKIQGKVSYMSPEQARCREIDARSDLYCCGLILYELIAGEKAYGGGSDMKKWKKAKNAKIDFNLLHNEYNEKGLINIIKRLLKEKPSSRYQNGSELFNDMKVYLEKHGSIEEIRKKYSSFLHSVLTDNSFLRRAKRNDYVYISDKKPSATDNTEDYSKKGILNIFTKAVKKIGISL